MRLLNFRPPRIAMLLVAIASLVHLASPTLATILYAQPYVGVGLGSVGFGIMMWGWWLFREYSVAICPTATTSQLITSRIYRLTRNPMYLGMTMMLLGIALFLGSAPYYVAAVVFFSVINAVFCPYEETKLVKLFGEEYLRYQGKVRRWL